MGKVTHVDIEKELTKDNPTVSVSLIAIYSDALRIYIEASNNIREQGAIVAHPRTGAPIENPYLKIQTAKGEVLAKMGNIIRSDRVMRMVR